MRLTRRQVATGIAGTAVSAGLGGPAAAQDRNWREYAERLSRDLGTGFRPVCPDSRLTLTAFGLDQTGSVVRRTWRMNALVRMDWPPGMRQCAFLFYGPDLDSAYGGPLEQVLIGFEFTQRDCLG